jgi:hypothetical protein
LFFEVAASNIVFLVIVFVCVEFESLRFSVDLVSSPGFIVKTLEQRHSCTGMNRLTSRNMTFTLAAIEGFEGLSFRPVRQWIAEGDAVFPK